MRVLGIFRNQLSRWMQYDVSNFSWVYVKNYNCVNKTPVQHNMHASNIEHAYWNLKIAHTLEATVSQGHKAVLYQRWQSDSYPVVILSRIERQVETLVRKSPYLYEIQVRTVFRKILENWQRYLDLGWDPYSYPDIPYSKISMCYCTVWGVDS